MALISTKGLELAEEQLKKLGRPMIKKIVEAGAGAAQRRMAETTQLRGHVQTGDMLKSIGPTEYREVLGGGKTDVYPLEEDRRGVRNATKAFVINYGRGRSATRRGSRSRMGDRFITGDKKIEEEVVEAMQAESDRLIEEI